jgi:hypothetical protein
MFLLIVAHGVVKSGMGMYLVEISVLSITTILDESYLLKKRKIFIAEKCGMRSGLRALNRFAIDQAIH